jgi:rSAM/selenodomain-associated transferase 1
VGDLLLVFLKHPRPGATKTRLIPALGEAAAAELYRALAEEEVRSTTPRAGEYARLLCFTPAEERASIASWFPGEELWPQPEGDLGERMAAAFAEGFRRGARRVAVVGTDVPGVGRDTVVEALSGLDAGEVVIGPSRDGGYYLLGLREERPELFEGIAWSTPAVLSATLARAEGLGLRVRLLGALTDVDTLEDLRAEWARLRRLLAPRPDLYRAVAAALSASS